MKWSSANIVVGLTAKGQISVAATCLQVGRVRKPFLSGCFFFFFSHTPSAYFRDADVTHALKSRQDMTSFWGWERHLWQPAAELTPHTQIHTHIQHNACTQHIFTASKLSHMHICQTQILTNAASYILWHAYTYISFSHTRFLMLIRLNKHTDTKRLCGNWKFPQAHSIVYGLSLSLMTVFCMYSLFRHL